MNGIKHDTPNTGKKFNASSRLDLATVIDHPESLQEIYDLEKERVQEQAEYKIEYRAHRQNWINEKALELYNQHEHDNRFNPPKPEYAYHPLWQDCVDKATTLIDKNIEDEIKSIDQASYKAQDYVVEQVGYKRQVLNREVQNIEQSYNTSRIALERDFDANTSHYVQIARENGSKQPERDAYVEYKSKRDELMAKADHQIKQTYEQHGFNYHMEEHALSQKYDIEMRM